MKDVSMPGKTCAPVPPFIFNRIVPQAMSFRVRKTVRPILHSVLKFITNFSYLVASGGKKVPILVYHRVCPLYYKKEFPYMNVQPEEFDRQMKYLKKNFEVITVSEYIKKAQAKGLNGWEICVTFDDGFKDNYMYAFPILKKYGLKATFFLTTKYIGGDLPFPWMALDRGAKEDLRVNRSRWLPLSWEEVKEMMRSGMEFGTHTHTHSDSLSKLEPGEAKREIEQSTRIFKEKIGVRPELFSYPHGTLKDYDGTHIELLQSHDYKAALTTNIGRNGEWPNLYELKRIIIYEEDTLWEFKKKTGGAYDFAEVLQKQWLNLFGSKSHKDYAN